MAKRKFLIIGVAAAAVLFWKLGWPLISSKFERIKKSADLAAENFKNEILMPPPLKVVGGTSEVYLTRGGVVKWTNISRADNGLSPLAENALLNTAARLKVEDMFSRQYFEHVSPTGGNIGILLDGVGYKYIAVGENLALGNFKNDEALVQAWMSSPGHRANILNRRFREIGVAVKKGIFEGRTTWLAVQTFALPLSACPGPDASLKSQVDAYEVQIVELKVRADIILTELENTPKRSPQYNEKVGEYNQIANQINSLIAEEKSSVSQYNQEVQAFNACAAR